MTLVLFLFLSSLLQYFDRGITTALSPKGMVSFQRTSSRQEGLKMLESWGSSGIEKAVLQTIFDFPFIVVYTLLAYMLVVLTAPAATDRRLGRFRQTWIKWGITLAVLAGVMDCVENGFILLALSNRAHYAALGVYIPALIKFILLAIIVAGVLFRSLQWISSGIFTTFRIVWTFRLIFFGLLFTCLILFGMDQGQDLLLSINSHPIGPVVTLITLSLFALANWYLPKYYDTADGRTFTLKTVFLSAWDYEDKIHREKTFTGRLLGAATLVLPGAAILNAMQVFRIHYPLEFLSPLTTLAILLIVYYLILQQSWLCDRRVVLVISVVCLALIIAFGFIPSNNKPVFLGLFALDFFLLSFVFLLFTNVRKGHYNSRFLNMTITPYILFSLLAVSLLFLLLNLHPVYFAFRAGRRFLTLPVVFTGIIFYIFLLSMLLITGRRYKIQLISLLLLGLFLAGVNTSNDFHRIRYVKHRNAADRVAYDSAVQYTRAWLLARKDEIKLYDSLSGGLSYPIFIINAYGGGIRAAAWTSKVVEAINLAIHQPGVEGMLKDQKDFQHYVFAYSGASGGTIGASVLCAQRYHQLKAGTKDSTQRPDFYKNDFLTPVLIALLGRDIWLFPFGKVADDRAGLQERTWEFHAHDIRDSFSYGLPISSYWYDADPKIKYEIPLLFANSYNIDSGLKAINAPVLLRENDFPASFVINNRLKKKYGDSLEMRMSTGAFLSARFPYISPEAKFDGFNHFMDGGLKENSGAETAYEIRLMLERTIGELKDSLAPVSVVMLSLPNSIQGTDSVQIAKNVFELTAPLTALMNNWVGNTYKADSVNLLRQQEDGYEYLRIRPLPLPPGSKMMPVLPLGWQISDIALNQMDSSIAMSENRDKIRDIVWRIKKGRRINGMKK